MPDKYLRQRPDGSMYWGDADPAVVVPSPPPPVVVPPVTTGKLYGLNWPFLYIPGPLDAPGCDMTDGNLAIYKKHKVNVLRLNAHSTWLTNEIRANGPHPYLDRLMRSMKVAGRNGMRILFDLHGEGKDIGTIAFPFAEWQEYHRRTTTILKSDPEAWAALWAIGTLNEPANNSGRWVGDHKDNSGYARAIAGIRQVDANIQISVSGNQYTNASSWNGSYGNESMVLPRNSHIEFHQYADGSFSGRYGAGQDGYVFYQAHNRASNPQEEGCGGDNGARFVARLNQGLTWAGSKGYQVFVGEFGVPALQDWMPHLEAFYKKLQDTSFVLGSTEWYGGYEAKSNWPYSGMQGVDPADDAALHWSVIDRYTNRVQV